MQNKGFSALFCLGQGQPTKPAQTDLYIQVKSQPLGQYSLQSLCRKHKKGDLEVPFIIYITIFYGFIFLKPSFQDDLAALTI
ncbi:hypothetical protein NFHSH190041_00250 [Shewanella sp. NFH-SH190041]|uniref:hypothetical protein n=1 Tax=Shewanella sp. NFH-SH190041 TaxID=2950245 RepID=UPI0021C38B35|nr:hypothetical protein [Shewanella sp. NFH-SH190041]BDM62573.1 hypothetical protein NFHSH190041_00250 [Shewanella sp. NFH-SH190041]